MHICTDAGGCKFSSWFFAVFFYLFRTIYSESVTMVILFSGYSILFCNSLREPIKSPSFCKCWISCRGYYRPYGRFLWVLLQAFEPSQAPKIFSLICLLVNLQVAHIICTYIVLSGMSIGFDLPPTALEWFQNSFYPRDAMLARSLRVCLSGCLSVTRRYCVKTVHFRHKVTMGR